MSPEISSFDQKSPERADLLGEAPHLAVLESVAKNLRKYGATDAEITAYLAPYEASLGQRYQQIIEQTALLEGASNDLAQFRLDRELKKVLPADEEALNAQIAANDAEYRHDLVEIIADGQENLTITV